MSGEEKSRLEALADEKLPLDVSQDPLEQAAALDTALLHLRRPFAPAAVRWKVQTAGDGFGIVIAYIDARLVTERLNRVVGGEWSDAAPLGGYRAMDKGVEECTLWVLGRARSDVGQGQGIQGAKATRSDSFKRAAVKFGVGVSIYALKSVLLNATAGKEPVEGRPLVKNSSYMKGDRKVWTAQLSKSAERWLADTYEKWLDARGIGQFGPVLDHGDELGAAGMEGEEQGAAPEPVDDGGVEVKPALADQRAGQLRQRIETAYRAIHAMNAAAVPPRTHRAELEAAQGSHEELEALAVRREGQLAQMESARKPKPKAKPKPAGS